MHWKIQKELISGKSVHDIAVELNVNPKSVKDILRMLNDHDQLLRKKNKRAGK